MSANAERPTLTTRRIALTERTNSTGNVSVMIRTLGALAVAAIGLGLGSGSAAEASQTRPPVVGGSAAQRHLVEEVVRRLGGTQLRRITITPSGKGRVRLTMGPPRVERSRANLAVRIEWDASLVSYSSLRLSLAQGLPAVEGFSVAGKQLTFRSLRPRPLPRFDRSRIVPSVARAVKRSGGRPIEFNLFRPAGPALAVVIATKHAGRFIQQRLEPIIVALNTIAPRLDGFYVAVTDSRRRVVFAFGRAEMRGENTSTVYVRDDLAGCAENLPVSVEVAPDGAPPCPQG